MSNYLRVDSSWIIKKRTKSNSNWADKKSNSTQTKLKKWAKLKLSLNFCCDPTLMRWKIQTLLEKDNVSLIKLK
jgi:hypothetical protein